jgi:hypothetical protein
MLKSCEIYKLSTPTTVRGELESKGDIAMRIILDVTHAIAMLHSLQMPYFRGHKTSEPVVINVIKHMQLNRLFVSVLDLLFIFLSMFDG